MYGFAESWSTDSMRRCLETDQMMRKKIITYKRDNGAMVACLSARPGNGIYLGITAIGTSML